MPPLTQQGILLATLSHGEIITVPKQTPPEKEGHTRIWEVHEENNV